MDERAYHLPGWAVEELKHSTPSALRQRLDNLIRALQQHGPRHLLSACRDKPINSPANARKALYSTEVDGNERYGGFFRPFTQLGFFKGTPS